MFSEGLASKGNQALYSFFFCFPSNTLLSLNSFDFTNTFIRSLTYQLHLKELRVANNIITLGGNTWRQKYLEGMNFY